MIRKLKTLEIRRLSLEDYHKSQKQPLIVVLDDVRSMHNVGSVFRTCDAFRAEGVYLCGITACPPMNEIHKTALGAEESVDWQHFDNACDAVRSLHEAGYKVLAVEQCEGSTKLPAQIDYTEYKGIAVILGNEVHGVHQEVIDMCDGCLEIPQYGTKHSLNVSVTAGIIIWEVVRQNLKKTQSPTTSKSPPTPKGGVLLDSIKNPKSPPAPEGGFC